MQLSNRELEIYSAYSGTRPHIRLLFKGKVKRKERSLLKFFIKKVYPTDNQKSEGLLLLRQLYHDRSVMADGRSIVARPSFSYQISVKNFNANQLSYLANQITSFS